MGFVKLHSQLFQSSIVEEDIVTRWVWICLLLSCDKNGNIYGTRAALARMANVQQFELDDSLYVLMKPDPNSTSKAEDGRRIIDVGPNLLHCVNYKHYRGMKDPVQEREDTKLRVRKHRAKKSNTGNKNVTKSNDIAESICIEANADAESPPKPPSRGETLLKKKTKHFKPPTAAEVRAYCAEKGYGIDPDRFVDFYESKGWMVGKNKMKSWRACVRTWVSNDSAGSGSENTSAWRHLYDDEGNPLT